MTFQLIKCMLLMHVCCSEYIIWTDDFQDLDNWIISGNDPQSFLHYEPYDCPNNNAPCLKVFCNVNTTSNISTSIQTDNYNELEISFDWAWWQREGNDDSQNVAFYYSCGINNVDKVKVAYWEDNTRYASDNHDLTGTQSYKLPESCNNGTILNIYFICTCTIFYDDFHLLVNDMKLTANYNTIATTTSPVSESKDNVMLKIYFLSLIIIILTYYLSFV